MVEPRAPDTRILYVEDDAMVGRLVTNFLQPAGYSLQVVPTGHEFRQALREHTPDLCLLDMHLPDTTGLDLLRELRSSLPTLPAIFVTASDEVQDVVTAIKLGASDYLGKPIDTQRLLISIRNALLLGRQEREIRHLRSGLPHAWSPDQILGSSAPTEALRTLLRKVAPTQTTVLISGESGTGKELIARALHGSSTRRGQPFIDVNCAAIHEDLLESALFGHEQGAFTGAHARHRGHFEQAHGGTIFLDEIGDMSPGMQTKILRLLEERVLQRVGGADRIPVDVRVLCATNRDLEEDVRQGRFRRDLLYRINTMVIEVPPLRDRGADIPELADHFCRRVADREKRSPLRVSPAAIDALRRHTWPGNIRELQHAVERAVIVCDGVEILPEHLPPAVLRSEGGISPPSSPTNLIEAVEALERSMIAAALEKCGGVQSRAAAALGITERMISYKMQNLGLSRAKRTGDLP